MTTTIANPQAFTMRRLIESLSFTFVADLDCFHAFQTRTKWSKQAWVRDLKRLLNLSDGKLCNSSEVVCKRHWESILIGEQDKVTAEKR